MGVQIVFVHGIGGPRVAEDERNRWSAALAEGCRLSGHGDVADLLADAFEGSSRFISYRDLFDQQGSQGAGELGLSVGQVKILEELLLELIELQLEEDQDPEIRSVLTHAHAELSPNGPHQGIGDLGRRAVNVATTLLGIRPLRGAGQWVSSRLMIRDLAQVVRYLSRMEQHSDSTTIDQRIRTRVLDGLGDAPIIVVAHSLGSIVVLEALNEFAGEVSLLVTLGSPIGMRTVVWPRIIPFPPRTPESVRTWLNFWDRDDLIVSRPHLDAEVLPNSANVTAQSRRIDSDGLWVHTATKYLAQPAVAGPIAENFKRHRQ